MLTFRHSFVSEVLDVEPREVFLNGNVYDVSVN